MKLGVEFVTSLIFSVYLIFFSSVDSKTILKDSYGNQLHSTLSKADTFRTGPDCLSYKRLEVT